MQQILKELKPMKIRSDKGSEFSNQWFRKYMKGNDIYFFTTENKTQANIVERCWLVGCFGFNGPLRQYFSLYRAASQREGERGEKG